MAVLTDLIPDPENRRTHTARNLAMLTEALQTVGAARSIVIDETGQILAGNGVVQAAAAAGLTKVQVVDVEGDTVVAVRRSGLSEDQKRALAIYDNRVAELAEWNWTQLAADRDAGLTMAPWFTDQEQAKGLKTPRPGQTDPEAVPEVRATTIQRGDLFQLGAHRLLCGDCTDPADLDRVLEGGRADVCLTDPPYGIGLEYATFDDTPEAVMALAQRWLPLARERCDVVCFSPGVTRQWWYPTPDWVLCWFYQGHLRSPWGFNCWQPFPVYGADPSLARGLGCRPDAITDLPSPRVDVAHPCPKPMALWEWLLQRLTFEVEARVLDVFCGSGTGIIAAEQLQRRCFALEIAPTYVQVTIDRWEAFTGQRAEQVR